MKPYNPLLQTHRLTPMGFLERKTLPIVNQKWLHYIFEEEFTMYCLIGEVYTEGTSGALFALGPSLVAFYNSKKNAKIGAREECEKRFRYYRDRDIEIIERKPQSVMVKTSDGKKLYTKYSVHVVETRD